MTGGEALSVAVAKRFFANSQARLHHFYGPTEAAIFCTYHACRADEEGDTYPIGRPVAQTTLRVVDDEGQPVPVGVPGELYVGGTGVAQGYVNDSVLSRERFVSDPTVPTSSERFYRTGDLVVYRADGELVFLGRRDTQIKLRGYRIELEEIEFALRAIDAVEDVGVVVQRLGGDRDRLVAFLVAPGMDAGRERTLVDGLAERLPDYMIPSRFVLLDKLPLTPAGKLDRRALPLPAEEEPGQAADCAPQDPVEARLLGIWRDLLGNADLNTRDDFFSHGGHSLLVLQMLVRIEKELHVKLPAKAVFDAPNVAALARLVDSHGRLSRPSSAEPRGTTLFCIAPGFGDEVSLAALSANLGGDNGMQILLPPSDSVSALPVLQQLARRYADQVIQHRKEGPYVIGGFSIAGILALEAARILAERGFAVKNVLLFETILPPVPTAWMFFFGKFLTKRVLPNTLRQRLPVWVTQAMDDAGLDAHVRICRGYRPRRYDGPVTLVVSSGTRSLGFFLFSWWRLVLPQLRIAKPVSGWHQTIFHGDGLRQLARRVDQILKEEE